MLGIVFWVGTEEAGSIPQSASTAIKVATSGGTVIGQVGFGWLADVVGMYAMQNTTRPASVAWLSNAIEADRCCTSGRPHPTDEISRYRLDVQTPRRLLSGVEKLNPIFSNISLYRS